MVVKKTYCAPNIEEHLLDQMICLFGGSDTSEPPIDLEAAPTSGETDGPSFSSPPAPEYPFGGSEPDYSDM